MFHPFTLIGDWHQRPRASRGRRVCSFSLAQLLVLHACCLFLVEGTSQADSPVQTAVSQLATRLAASRDEAELAALDDAAILQCLTPEEREIFATQYWCFDVDTPAVVSIMRHTAQEIVPFWLADAGFVKTPMTVRNEEYEYEVWQRIFDAGRVLLGINGFDKHRPHYFVAVGPKDSGPAPSLGDFMPPDQRVFEMREGATIYHDWPELVLTEVPPALRGHMLLPTIRGRAREAHLVGAFRKTEFPASAQPDQVLLTWSGDPRTSVSVQWRAAPAVETGIARYRRADAAADAPWTETTASVELLEDAFITNDPRVRRFTATLTGLQPDTAYAYIVGDPARGACSDPAGFRTAPATRAPFTFLFLSDTHNSPAAGELLEAALKRNPGTAFAVVSGDLVGTGQYRDDWDKFFAHCASFTRQRPLMPSIGNHDAIDGLGADLYLASFDLPRNGPPMLAPERTYAFEYGDALFLMMDVTEPITPQADWIDAQLEGSDAKWKFAVLHFPAHFPEDSDPQIRDSWCPVFDKHHVDFVLSGHVHDYMRSYPMRGGEVVESPKDGTIYMLTISLNDGGPMPPKPEYAAAMEKPGVAVTVAFRVERDRVLLQAEDVAGRVYDRFVVEKE